MLRLYCLQQWFNLSDPTVEEALYDSRVMRQFVGIDLGHEPGCHHHQCLSSTKNRTKGRDPEMHQRKKGNQWYFGMKEHIGVDSQTKLICSVAATAANVHDIQVLPELLHGQETRVWGN